MHTSRLSAASVILLVGLSALATTTGCTQLTQAEIKALETRELDLPYDEAYKAAANGLFSLGFTIDHSDKESGVISGRRVKKTAGMSVTFLLILPLPTINESTLNEAVTFMLTKLEPKLTELRMKFVVDGNPVINREFMTKIWQQIEREAMLETGPSEQKTKTKSADAAPGAETG